MVERAVWRVGLAALFVVGCTSTPPTPTSHPFSTSVASATPAAAGTASASPLTTASAPSTASPNPTGFGPFPASVLGMPVRTVAQAHVLQAAGKLDGRVVAVGGYWSQVAIPCPFTPHESVMDGFCSGITFADTDEKPAVGIGDANLILPLEAANGDQLWPAQTQDAPAAVVLIMHSLDSRAWQCKPEDREQCKNKLVIDRVAWINGQDQVVNSPRSALTLAELHLTPDQASSAALRAGETLLFAYPLRATTMNSIDPRFLGVGARPAYPGSIANAIWYVRAATTTPDSDGVSDATARVIDDVTAAVLREMPMTVAADYEPARLIIDEGQNEPNFPDGLYPHGAVRLAGDAVYADSANLSSTPLAVSPGAYELHGYIGSEMSIGDPQCTAPLTISADKDVAYAVTFTKKSCSWSPSTSPF